MKVQPVLLIDEGLVHLVNLWGNTWWTLCNIDIGDCDEPIHRRFQTIEERTVTCLRCMAAWV